MLRLTQQARSVLDSAIDRLEDHTNTDMSDYMIRGNDIEEENNPWDDSPFTKTYQLAGDPSPEKAKKALSNAEKIHSKIHRSGSISTDEAVEPAMATIDSYHDSTTFYYRICGPVAASADDIEWSTAFRVDLETAPELHSDEWYEVASGFNLSPKAEDDMIPKKIKSCYGTLLKKTKRNDGERAIHPEELREYGPAIRDRHRQTAFDHIARIPGVDGPDESGPVWQKVDPELSDTYEQDSKSENAEVTG